MRTIRCPRTAAFAGACALALASAIPLAAQDDKQEDKGDTEKSPAADRGAKRTPEGQKPSDAADHKALTRANQAVASEAHALAERAADKDIELSKVLVSRHVEAIGRALEESRVNLAAVETSAPQNADTRQRLQAMHAAYDRAAEHHRALLQLATDTKLAPGEIEKNAKGIAAAAEDAEAAHRKLAGATATEPARKSKPPTDKPADRPQNPSR